MTKEQIKALQEAMTHELSIKTGWGRNEIMAALDRAIMKVVLEELEKHGTQ